MTVCQPIAAHWLGDRNAADATRHAVDRTGCVLYFATEAECDEFMAWLATRNGPDERSRTDGEQVRHPSPRDDFSPENDPFKDT